ncbi:Cytochrome c-type biogenesis protein DsbD, protein-disulfide reductase [Caenispirillum salinarum AK4]|uniref:Cytochrome c-type biogenesis protein DsbD, protein-disulfide reductase n=1 Tax=Caenispirillum salinarum AK4 TaxID=1238182 RepID=K9H2V0_9PROT|nr:protein-disulfide reductase DsbD domain-containing protein [Caenispirillum salinarum]EKV32575.1 Cytochrome c-type biogenesis protein DsbD, protein-disulfide reductase [Caenispirillum salinarum AK4]
MSAVLVHPVRLLSLLLLALLAVLTAAPATAQWAELSSSAWVETPEADIRLISKVGATGGREEITLGLHFDLKDDWKVYWRDAGDAGYPPEIDWSGSENIAATEMRYPAPHRFSVLGIQSAGYKDEVIYPITVRLAEPGKPVTARAALDYLICSDICVPGSAELTLAVAGGPGGPSQFAHAIESWEARVPGDGAGHGLSLAEAVVETGGEQAVLRAIVTADPPLSGDPDIFVEGPEDLRVGPPEVTLKDGGATAILRAPIREGGLPDAEPVSLTIVQGDRGMTVPATPQPVAPEGIDWTVFATMLGLALVGGLILNVMPCVLPVLSLKVMGVAQLGGAERRTVRLSFLAAAAGIVATFLVLAGLAAGLKGLGVAVGWGIQFQQPLFLIAMVVLLSLFAANLFGFFEVRLPGAVSDMSAGHGKPHSLAGHFGSGVFATLLATPCTAPFLGTAVGFALAAGPLEIVAVFAALGLGMAAPYLTLAAAPGFARRLPRPGRWMLTVKKVLGVALAATAAWLIWVLSAQIGDAGALVVAALMIAAVAVLGAKALLKRPRGVVASSLVAGLAAAAFAAPYYAPVEMAAPGKAAATDWQPFDRAAIPDLVAAGNIVFVDVTADWCVTCLVNKEAVIERGAVAEALKQAGVVPMQADWTNPDDTISRYLNSFGRYGIPFNAVYGPGVPEGIPLPELLTEGAVMEALDKARAPASG